MVNRSQKHTEEKTFWYKTDEEKTWNRKLLLTKKLLFKRQTKLESADTPCYQRCNSIRLKRIGTTKAEKVGGKKYASQSPFAFAECVFMHGVCVCLCVCVCVCVCVSNACACVCIGWPKKQNTKCIHHRDHTMKKKDKKIKRCLLQRSYSCAVYWLNVYNWWAFSLIT